MDPNMSKKTAVNRGPHISHNFPIINRAMIVEETEIITRLPICDFVRCRSVRMVGIKGARPNQPKKQTKNISQVM